MTVPIKVLLVEDSADDGRLLVAQLHRDGWEVTHERVDTSEAMAAAISSRAWDLVIADYALPQFSALDALRMVRERGLDIPFILVSGAIGEEAAVQALKAGANDYLFKNNLSRLTSAIQRELRETEDRRALNLIARRLEVSETRHRRMFETTQDGILILDAQTAKVLEVNQFLTNLLGQPREYFLGKELWEIGVFKDAESSKSAIASLGATGSIPHESLPLQHKDGRQIPVEFVSNVYFEGGNSVIQFNIRDISNRRLAEAQLRRAQDLLQSVLDTSTAGILLFQAIRDGAAGGTIVDFEFRLANPAAERMLKRRAEELIGKRLLTVLPGNRTAGLFERYIQVVGTDRPLDLELYYNHDGLANWFRVAAVKVGDGFSVTFEDVTDRKESEEALRESEGRLRAVVETAVDGIITIDDQGIISLFNPAAARIFGYAPEEVAGKEVSMLMPDPFSEAFHGHLQEYLKTGIKKVIDIGREVTARRKDGSLFPMDLAVSETWLGERRLFTGIVRDISERKQVERELAKAKEDAEAANRSKSEFLANMSHEIRTPMSAILGFANMVVNKEQDKTGRIECAQIIRRNAMHLLELINEILDLSKIEALQMKVESVPCDLMVMLSEIISLMRPRAMEKGLAFDVSFEGAIPRQIQTDPMRLRQILVNLLGNAMKFTDTGKISLRVSDEGTGTSEILLRVDVIDSGIGMSPEQLGRLFRPFTQADESITRKFGGTGLGLTISSRLAKLLGGDISVTTELGVGSTFTLRVDGGPSSGIEVMQNLTESMLPKSVGGAVQTDFNISGRILLVDDGHDNQRLLRMLLGDAGADVSSAENGQIAVEMATSQSFDLILMDMQMPVMDGYAATAELRRRGIKIPIIALTANAMLDDRKRCMECGCSYYLSKPVKEEVLLKAVRQHIGNDGSAGAAKKGAEAGAGTPSAQANGNGGGRITSRLADNPRYMRVLPGFIDGLPQKVSAMIDLLSRNELAELQKVVHQLRGASGGYGFDSLTDPALRAEEAIKSMQVTEVITAEVNSLIETIRQIDGYDESRQSVDATHAAG